MKDEREYIVSMYSARRGVKCEEIVRCKDCARWRDDCEWNRFFNDQDLDEPMGYCAWAERREQ